MIFRVYQLKQPLEESSTPTSHEVKNLISTAQSRGENKIRVTGLRYETRQALTARGFKLILISNAGSGSWQVSWVTKPVRVPTLTRVLNWIRGSR